MQHEANKIHQHEIFYQGPDQKWRDDSQKIIDGKNVSGPLYQTAARNHVPRVQSWNNQHSGWHVWIRYGLAIRDFQSKIGTDGTTVGWQKSEAYPTGVCWVSYKKVHELEHSSYDNNKREGAQCWCSWVGRATSGIKRYGRHQKMTEWTFYLATAT